MVPIRDPGNFQRLDMNQASPLAAFAKAFSLTSHFALMTDISRVLPAPAEHPSSQVPGILFSRP